MVNNENINKNSLVCRVKKVIYYNKENGYSVLSVVSDTEEVQFSICGTLNGMPVGRVLRCQGRWNDHIVYGRQFLVETWEEGKEEDLVALGSCRKRANSRPVYRSWGDMLKYNPDVAQNVKYVTEVFLTDVDKDFDNADNDGSSLVVPVTAQVKAVYSAIYNNQKVGLITCSFTVYGSVDVELDDEDINCFGAHIDVDTDRYARKNSVFVSIYDFDGLSNLDFRASGVPTCEEEMMEKYYVDNPEDLEDYSVDNVKTNLEFALDKALRNAGIDYEDGEYECTRMFSRNKINGELF